MKKLSNLLIIASIILFLIPVIGSLRHSYNQNKILKELDAAFAATYRPKPASGGSAFINIDSTANDVSQSDLKSPDNDIALNSGHESSNYESQSFVIDGQWIIGIIDIPAIKLRSPIIEGVALENLAVGIGHFPGTAGIGKKGNSVYAGHRSYTFGDFFNRLDELKIGNTIYMQNMKSKYEYRIFDKFIILPDDFSVLENSNETIITLITCHPLYNPTHRLIVQANLVQ